jgi:hypothetical protein
VSLYIGPVYEFFLVDRAAMGFPPEMIQEEFKAAYGTTISLEQIDSILTPCQDRIREREQEILKEMKESSVLGRLETTYRKIAENLYSEEDPKTLSMLAREARGLLEAIAKVTGQVKEQEIKVDKVLILQQNYTALEELEQMELISIADRDKLKRKMGLIR